MELLVKLRVRAGGSRKLGEQLLSLVDVASLESPEQTEFELQRSG